MHPWSPTSPEDAPPQLFAGHKVYLAGQARGTDTVKTRWGPTILRMGGTVVELAERPTLAVLEDNHGERGRKSCTSWLQHLQSSNRIVRERWMRRVDGLGPDATSLPDFKPDAVYALVRDLRNPSSFFYDADADTRRRQDHQWLLTRRAWTPSAQAGGAG